ncbi:hypothetical protein DXG01_011453 [Tephrocybe rancida]|nr:hypothetical protein DXG01_011453 [Tephrocybe rancida]
MIISHTITLGQLTFILRVAVQILSYGGPFLIGVIILGSVPRLAPIDTHDIVNRVVGASSATRRTGKWIVSRIRRNTADPIPPTNLILVLFLSITYTAFVSLSDIGFLGLYACPVPGPTTSDLPASIASDDAARSFVSAHMVNGTELAMVSAWRCDASAPTPGSSLTNCTSWRNSTYADPALFDGINSTDSDVLLLRQLRYAVLQEDPDYNINSFYLGPDTQRLLTSTVFDGIAVNPHVTGVQIVAGVPRLSPSQNVTIPQTLAIELEVGCMSLGVSSVQQVGHLSGYDFFTVDDTWQKYTGPDYLHDVLLQSAIATRTYLRPFFNESTLSNGLLRSINITTAPLSPAAKITQHYLPTQNSTDLGVIDASLLSNCTAALQAQIGLAPSSNASMCGYFGIGGTLALQGAAGLGFTRMICASATQVNMVSSIIAVSSTNRANISLTRLPSTLHYVRADFVDDASLVGGLTGIEATLAFLPYERYTLSSSPSGPSTHFISPRPFSILPSQVGPGSGGSLISTLSSILLDPTHTLTTSTDYAALKLLPAGFTPLSNFSTSLVTEWLGQVGGSVATASLTYNGWAARQMQPVLVTSSDGVLGACYKPFYAFGFLPLVLAAALVVAWTVLRLLRGSLFGSQAVKEAYGGLAPYTGAVSSEPLSKETLLVWEQGSQPWLQVVGKGYPITGEPSDTTLQYFEAHSKPGS